MFRRAGNELVARVRRGHHLALVARARELGGFGVQLQLSKDVGFARRVHIDRIDQHDRATSARVITALGDGVAEQFVVADAQSRKDRFAKRRLGVIQRQVEVGQS